MKIVFVSGHYPSDTPFAIATHKGFENYTARHGYGFFYDDSVPESKEMHELHYRRCVSLDKASRVFLDAKWFVWVDSDVFVNRPDIRLESCIDLSNPHYLYHLFHEKPWEFPINTGVKIVNRDAIVMEKEIYNLRNTPPWNQFPYEQKAVAEYLLPKIGGYYKIHDPYILNYILHQPETKLKYDPKNAVFIHMCTRTTNQRNKIMDVFETEHRILTDNELSMIKE